MNSDKVTFEMAKLLSFLNASDTLSIEILKDVVAMIESPAGQVLAPQLKAAGLIGHDMDQIGRVIKLIIFFLIELRTITTELMKDKPNAI